MLFLSPFNENVLKYAGIAVGAGLLRALIKMVPRKPEIKEPETLESIRSGDKCRTCGHVRAFHQQKAGDATQECSDCTFSLIGKNVTYTSFHNFKES